MHVHGEVANAPEPVVLKGHLPADPIVARRDLHWIGDLEFVPDSTIGCTGDGIGEATAGARLGGAPDASGAAPLPALQPTSAVAMTTTANRNTVSGVYIRLGSSAP